MTAHKYWYRVVFVIAVTRVRVSERHHYRRQYTKHYRFILHPGKNDMTTNVTVGHQVDYSYEFVDVNGNPMQTPPTPDHNPTWSDSPSAAGVDTFTPAANGATAVVQALAAGSDTVSFSVSVGGVAYTASDQVLIAAAPQVLGGVKLIATVV